MAIVCATVFEIMAGPRSLWMVSLPGSIPWRVQLSAISHEPHLGGGIRSVGDVLTRYLDEHDPKTLVTYGEKVGNAAIFKRLRYLLESLTLNQPGLITEARSRLSSGILLLEPSAPPSGPRVPRWGIRANAHITQDGPS